MTKRTLLGMLTPSSNTVLEPVTSAILADLPDVTAHFGRFRVTEISLSDKALGQFSIQPILDTASWGLKPMKICAGRLKGPQAFPVPARYLPSMKFSG